MDHLEEDAIILAVLLGAAIAFWFLKSRMRKKELEAVPEPVVVPSRTAAHAGREYWDRYDSKDAWSHSVATEQKNNFAGGKNGRPMDVLLPKREYIPKKQKWAGSGTASGGDRASPSAAAERDEDQYSSGARGLSENEVVADEEQSPAVSASKQVESQQVQVGVAEEVEDDVGWEEPANVTAEDTVSGRKFLDKVHEKNEEGWRLDEQVVTRLIQEGFGVRAAARAVLVAQDFDESLLFLFRRLQDGW
eukprot:131391-Rhodomonas_salina.1